ncbi:MAG TPA: hypothetical protein VIM70_17870 [Clostridium sp.]|uniref:hypothetical protein n=1 Tax=Clostridium sp. TaxID=1506 RepID=UPI002F922E24
MYDYRCKNCENYGQCMPMANMPMMNMPMMNMPMENMPMMNMPMENMPMMNMPMENMPMMNMPMENMPMDNMPMMNMPMDNMPMMNMPMMNMPMSEEDDEDLKSMYPMVYIIIHPMVKHHYDMMVAKHGKMYCPGKDELDHICKEIAEKYKEHHRSNEEDNDDDCNDDNMRERGRHGSGIQNLAKILLIGSLLGGRNYYGW